MLNTHFPPWPDFTEEEGEAVKRVLLSNRVNQWTGSEVRAFEAEFAEATDCRHAVAVANGTLALDLALNGLGIGAGDEVVVTPRSFIASASCVVNAGAKPVFADVDRNSQNLTAHTIEQVLSPSTRAVIVVHLAGFPADMTAIMKLADTHGLVVIEDCAQAHGARLGNRSVGSLGHVAAWSFCQDKIMSTGGEGGMVTTNDEALFRRMWSYKDHGKSWEAVHEREHPPGFRWLHDSIGTNWRLTEMQAAIGRIQLRRLDHWSSRRRHNAEQIWKMCSGIDWLRVPSVPADVTHAAYKAYVFIRAAQLPSGWSRDTVVAAFLDRDVPVYSGSCSEMYREGAFEEAGAVPAEPLPVARELGEDSLMFLVHPTIDTAQISQVEAALHAIDRQIKEACQQCGSESDALLVAEEGGE
jgi:dTDP-4-amino-4,6-dideoxygalactose transaminase